MLAFQPRIDVRETDAEIAITAELPGLEEKDFDVSIEADVLTLKGEKRTESETAREGWRHVETTSGSFERRILLPEGVDPEAVKAMYKHGVLTVRVVPHVLVTFDVSEGVKRVVLPGLVDVAVRFAGAAR